VPAARRSRRRRVGSARFAPVGRRSVQALAARGARVLRSKG